MIRKILFLSSLLSLPALVFGQGVAVPPSTAFKVVNGITQPFSGATITVCAANTSGIPCSPVLTGALFFDTGLTQPKPNPFQADANGNYAFAIAPGTYTITITGTGFAGYSYQMTSPGTGSGGGGGGTSTNVFSSGAVLGPLTFATLPGSAANGTVAIVSDGTAGPVCTGGGGGALAYRVAGVWTCNSPISGYIGAYTVATLPAASSNTSQLVRVTDGISSSDCTGGGGATNALCLSNGTSWQGVGGASSVTFATLAGGTNNSAAMHVGTGSSLNTSGTGSIQATGLPFSTVASLPTTLPTGTIYKVTDGSFQGDCSLGGGSFPALCGWNGSIWQPVGDGGGVTSNPGTINLAISYNMSCATTNGTGASTTTNGTIGPGSTTIALASTTGLTVGQGIFIAGAGAASGPYNGIITAVGGGNVTVNVATATSVTGAQVFSYAAPIQTTTSGTVGAGTSIAVVSAATFEAGQGIYIAGAGAAAANYVGKIQSVNFGTNTITVTPATSTGVTNALVQHDESAALNSAITDLASGVTNGMLMPPAGICLFNGPLLRTGDANAIIPLPNVPYNTNGTFTSPNGPTLGITIAGATTPAWSNYNLNGWTALPTFSGTIFQTSVTSGNFIAGQNPNETDKFTAIHLTLRDLTFRTVDNPGITMVNAAFVIGLSAERLLFDTLANGAQAFPSQPTHSNGQGLITPTGDNDAQNFVRDIRINGYYLAMTWGEHLNVDHAILYANWQGLACNISSNLHRSVGFYIDVENNAYGIVANGGSKCWLDILSFDTELNLVPAWVSGATNQAQIYDPNNWLTGNVRVTLKTYYSVFGAKNLNVSFADGPQITAGALAFVPGVIGFANLSGEQPDKNSNANCNRQALEVTLATTPSAGTTQGCVGTLAGGAGFNFTGQTVTIRVPHVLTPHANLYNVFNVGSDPANQLSIYVNNTTIGFAKEVAGGQTVLATATYNPNVMLWWRMAESSGAVTASYSPDGINWTTLGTCAATCVSWSYTSTFIGIQAVTVTGAGPAQPGYLLSDNWTLTANTPNYSRQLVTDGQFGSTAFKDASACETAFATTTLSTGATTTDTGQNCLPANAIIDSVVYRITTTITTAANFTIGDATTAARFCSTQSTLTSGTTGVCFVQADQTGAGGPRQTAAAKVRVTTNVNPGAGAIRLIVYYHTWTAPTS